MILEFGMKNFYSFKEQVTISLRLDSNCPKNVSGGRPVATVMGIKGANGSGKTQILKAISFLSDFCTNSFGYKPEATLAPLHFYKSTLPIEFYVEFCIDKINYRYELELVDGFIKRETIYRTQIKKVKIFERNSKEITYRISSLKALDLIKLRKNASIISTAHQYEVTELEEIYYFFSLIETNVGHRGFIPRYTNFNNIAEYLSENKQSLDFVRDFIVDCDTGISDIKIMSRKDKDGTKDFFPVFFHDVEGVKYSIGEFTESSGTKALFTMLPSYFLALKFGTMLLVDEIDMNLHPHILPKLIQLFTDHETNPKSAQLIFVTHDSEILETLGRYRTYLVAKQENQSFAYRLDEIPGDILRNDRPIRSAYNSGRIGGVPRI